MPAAFKFEAAYNHRGTLLDTHLNSLANDARSAPGTTLDNDTNLDQYAKAELVVTFASTPAANAYVALYALTAPDGTHFEDGSDTVDPGPHRWVANFPVRAASGTQRLACPAFALEPARTRFILLNKTGQPFAASGNTLKIFTTNDEAQ